MCYNYSDSIYCYDFNSNKSYYVNVNGTSCYKFTINQDFVFCPNQRFDNVFNNSNLGNVALLEQKNLNYYSYYIPTSEFKANSGK